MVNPSMTGYGFSSPRRAGLLVVLLAGLHLGLLGAGAFCTADALNFTSPNHSHPAASTSILCFWACHVAHISSGAGQHSEWSVLLLAWLFWPLKPLPVLFQTVALHDGSPRGPPLPGR